MSQLMSAPIGAMRAMVCQRPAAAATTRQAFSQQQVRLSARRGLCRAAAADETAAPQAEADAQLMRDLAPDATQQQPSEQQPQQQDAVKPNLMSGAWQQVVDWKRDNTTIDTVIKTSNRSGLNMQIGKLTGFLPYKLMDPSRVQRRREDGTLEPTPPKGYPDLCGKPIRVKITQVIVPEKRLIVSEKAVLLEDLAAVVEPGDVVEGVVGGIMDWGAFIECRSVRGEACPRAEAVLPLREMSYAWVANAKEVLSPGQPVRVVVLFRQSEPTPKVVVSLKRLEDDPLKETLDKVLPLGESSDSRQLDAVPASVPQGIEEILEALSNQPGVEAVTLGRTVEEKRTVSQDLELWITKEVVEDGYNLAVRAGRVVQEVRVATSMSADEMRTTVQRVLRSIN